MYSSVFLGNRYVFDTIIYSQDLSDCIVSSRRYRATSASKLVAQYT